MPFIWNNSVILRITVILRNYYFYSLKENNGMSGQQIHGLSVKLTFLCLWNNKFVIFASLVSKWLLHSILKLLNE